MPSKSAPSKSSSSKSSYTPPSSTGWINVDSGEKNINPRPCSSPNVQLEGNNEPKLKKHNTWLDKNTFNKAMQNTKVKIINKVPKKGNSKLTNDNKIDFKESEIENGRKLQLSPSSLSQVKSYPIATPSSPSNLASELTNDKALSQLAKMRKAAGLSPVNEEKRAQDRIMQIKQRRENLEMRKAFISTQKNVNEGFMSDNFQHHLEALATYSKRLNEEIIPNLKNKSNVVKNNKFKGNQLNTSMGRRSSIDHFNDVIDDDDDDDDFLFTQSPRKRNQWKSFSKMIDDEDDDNLLDDKSVLMANSPSKRFKQRQHVYVYGTPSPPTKRTRNYFSSLRNMYSIPNKSFNSFQNSNNHYWHDENSIPIGAKGFPELERAWEGTRSSPTSQKSVDKTPRSSNSHVKSNRQSLISSWITPSQKNSIKSDQNNNNININTARKRPRIERKEKNLDHSSDRPEVSLELNSDDDLMEYSISNKLSTAPLDFLYQDSPNKSSERVLAELLPFQQSNTDSSLPTPTSNIPGKLNLMRGEFILSEYHKTK